MSEHTNKPDATDDANAEAEAQKQVNVDEIREDLAEKFGLDPEEQSDLLEKLTERELEHREKLSSAIKQKIKYREQAQSQKSEKQDTSNAQPDANNLKELLQQELSAFKQNLELEQLGLPEEIQAEVQKLAKLNNVSVREAVNDPYVQFKLSQIEQNERIVEGTPTRSHRGGQRTRTEAKAPKPEDFDLTTEEGREKWNEAKTKYRASRST